MRLSGLTVCILFTLAGMIGTPPTARAQIQSTWTGVSGTSWTDAANWTSSSFPNNGQPNAGDTYDALIDLAGTVDLNGDIEIENLTLDDAGLSFRHNVGTLICNQGIDINSGVYRFGTAILKDTVVNLNGGQFELDFSSTTQFENVTFNGDLTVDETSIFRTGTIVNGDLDISGFVTTMYIVGNKNGYQYDVESGRTIGVFDGRLNLSNNLQFTVKPGATIEGDGRIESLGGETTLTNDGVIMGTSGELSIVQIENVINNGLMIAEAAQFGDLAISAANFTNFGTITAEPSRDIILGGNWTNENGIINLDDAASLQLAGEFTTSNIGTINLLTGNAFVFILAGTWDNTGFVSDLSEFGGNGVRVEAWVNPGIIKGGVIDNSAQLLSFEGSSTSGHVAKLDGVQITGGLDFRPGPSSTNVQMINNADIDGDVHFDQFTKLTVFGATPGDTATFELNGGTLDLGFNGKFGADGEMDLTIGPATTIRGGGLLVTNLNALGDGAIILQGTLLADTFTTFLETDYFENQGLIRIDAGATLDVRRFNPGSSDDLRFVQTSGTTLLNGGELQSIDTINYDFTDLEFPGGRLEGEGLIRGNVIIGGTLAIGQSSGQIDCTDGDFTITSGAVLDFELGGTSQGAGSNGYDFLNLEGVLTLGGQLNVSLIDNFGSLIQFQDQFVIMESLGGIVDQFENVSNGGMVYSSDGLFSFTVHYGPGSVFNPNQVVITDATQRTPTEPFGNKLLDGVTSAGKLSDIGSSDDVYLELDPSPTKNPIKQKIDLILLAETSVASPTSFQFRVEAAMSGGPEGDVIQTVELWNEQGNVWDVYDVRSATNSDTGILVTATGDLSRYVHPLTGEIIAKIKWETPEFSGPPFNWSVDLDQAVWFVE